MLLFWREQEVLQQLRGAHLPTATQVHVVGNSRYHVDDFVLLVELQTLLREVAELHRLAYHDASFIYRHQSQQHLDERRFARSVAAHDAHLLEAREVVVEVLENDNLAIGY